MVNLKIPVAVQESKLHLPKIEQLCRKLIKEANFISS